MSTCSPRKPPSLSPSLPLSNTQYQSTLTTPASTHPTYPEYSRPFELKLVGDREHLPRGILIAGTRQHTDEGFFKSVHLGGTQQAQIVADAIQKEKEEWAAKVVVDSTTFRVGHLSVRDKPIQMERAEDILHDEPARRDLKTLRYKTSKSTGKLITYGVPPLSIFNSEPYSTTSQSASVLARHDDRTKFITTYGKLPPSLPSSK